MKSRDYRYRVCLVFRSDGTYLPNKSKCDCPNGWLFCSHSLALFLLVRLVQVKRHWTYDDLCAFMPQPIKSLQNIPLPASMVFKQGCPRKAAFTLAKSLRRNSRDIPKKMLNRRGTPMKQRKLTHRRKR
mmetsp:Transcript_4644/g.7164  ORF Transcript_4644/g.7164 Transcript_4644/m.7164 type:complete len:129 (-) Transcript_4644:641-1027(-)